MWHRALIDQFRAPGEACVSSIHVWSGLLKAPDSSQTERQGVGIAIQKFEGIGFAFREQSPRDFGIDAHAELIEFGQPTGRILAIQLKTGFSYFSERGEDGFVFRTDQEHTAYWLNHSLPVLICLCDVDKGVIYWQAVNTETAISTGKGYKFIVTRNQRVDGQSRSTFHDILTPVITGSRYTIFAEEDQSHSAAKRYSCHVVLNGTLSKVEIAAVVRQLTRDGVKKSYHRNHLIEARWGDSDAHVVWTFIYPSAEDYANRNFFCRSCWISDTLPKDSRPLEFEGENVGGNIIVDWNLNYSTFAELGATSMATKEEYFSRVILLAQNLEPLLSSVEQRLGSLLSGELTENTFLSDTESTRSLIRTTCLEIEDIPSAPFECKEMDQKLRELAACLDNIVLLYSIKGMKTWNEHSRLQQSLRNASAARRNLQHFRYEMEKVQ